MIYTSRGIQRESNSRNCFYEFILGELISSIDLAHNSNIHMPILKVLLWYTNVGVSTGVISVFYLNHNPNNLCVSPHNF